MKSIRCRFFTIGGLLACCLMIASCGSSQDSSQNIESRSWNTFLGSSEADGDACIAADADGNIYVAGYSFADWGSPISGYANFNDTFVAKIDKNGSLVWSTFLGPTGTNGVHGCNLVLDSAANIYVTGLSMSNWGSPINPWNFGSDTFVAKLNNNGQLVWNTFLNSNDNGCGGGIAVDGSGNIYVTGGSYQTWGSPIRLFAGHPNVFVAKLGNDGGLVWNTFLGSVSGNDNGYGMAVDGNGNVYVVGGSYSSWGSPIRSHSNEGVLDAFVAKLNASGEVVWNTFFGSDAGYENVAYAVAIDGNGAAYITGTSLGTNGGWGSPVLPYQDYDAFVAKTDANGTLLWNTFLGSSDWDDGNGIALDGFGHVFVTGSSYEPWGPGAGNYHSGVVDAFVAELDHAGRLIRNTFVGSTYDDYGEGIAVAAGGRIYLVGTSEGAWGSPIRPFSQSGSPNISNRPDVFMTKVSFMP